MGLLSGGASEAVGPGTVGQPEELVQGGASFDPAPQLLPVDRMKPSTTLWSKLFIRRLPSSGST